MSSGRTVVSSPNFYSPHILSSFLARPSRTPSLSLPRSADLPLSLLQREFFRPSQTYPSSPVDAGQGSDFRAPYSLMRTAPSSHKRGQYTAQEGLGCLPSYIPSVTALLLFNTSDNPYKTYVRSPLIPRESCMLYA